MLGRALFHSPNYWQDEAAVFLLVGATFMTAAYVQSQRGHVGIEAFVGLLSPLANRIRLWLVDVASLLFCAFFAWKSWTLAHEAWVDGQVSNSMWSPPLAIPYVLMALGMTLLCVQTPAADHHSLDRSGAPMSVFGIGLSYGVATLFAMFSGMPIAFALGAVAVVFMAIYMPAASLDTVTQNVYEEMASITLLSIPLFILKGAAIGKSRAGQDLYSALHAWLHRVPGGLGVANVFACALFAAMAGSSPATCSAIGSAGIPEMRKRGYSGGFAAGIIAAGGTLGILLPPSITMILFAVAAEKSLGRLFLAGIGPGLLLVTLFGDLCRVPVPQGICRRHARSTTRPAWKRAILHARRFHHGRAIQRAAARAAVRAAADRRDDRALRRLRDAVGNRGPRRAAGAGADRRDLQRVAAERSGADPEVDHPRFHHADDDHRHVAALFLRDELSAHLAIGRGSRSSPCICRAGNCWSRSWSWWSCSASSCRRCRSS